MGINPFPGLIGLGDIQDERLRRMLTELSDWAETVSVEDRDFEAIVEESAPYVEVPIPLTSYVQRNTRNADQNVHGALLSLTAAQPLDSLNPINVTKGIGKIILVLNAGTDVSGTITFTGDTVDRDTGTVTAGDTESITVDALTTDDSDTDAQGNARYDFTGAYITSKWYSGAVAITTANTTFTDVDVYHCSFEQFNDYSNLTVRTFDINTLTTNANAWIYAYLYVVGVWDTGPKVDIDRVATLSIASGSALLNQYWRLRYSNIDWPIDGAKDGVFVDMFLGPLATAYFDDLSMKVWATMKVDVQGG